MSFDASLARVLDPKGLYWDYPDEQSDDPSVIREVEVRLDVPRDQVGAARSLMEREGWLLTARPDEPHDPTSQLYFRKQQTLLAHERTAMLTLALQVAREANGRFWSWLNRPDEK